ncbi:hypothetical protein C8N35_10361 [Breoghania corrubedonensis]|uniref:DUF1674 domain-containing protein n=1 Tax=Breoghania corrubedonensis TaxID=665038 RepID=A0A2T5VAU6_9HYPH|nr:DUF1674 domain-containing protein [Breoghania corrubedonensis]PTW60882.1 hypothetical protein C8N35_10361 [Breoghania corrubedonensis]
MTETDRTQESPASANRATEIRQANEKPAEEPRRRFEDLPPAAQRALMEAEERRKAARPVELAKEVNGRNGPEPTRYGDWEKKGIASDF